MSLPSLHCFPQCCLTFNVGEALWRNFSFYLAAENSPVQHPTATKTHYSPHQGFRLNITENIYAHRALVDQQIDSALQPLSKNNYWPSHPRAEAKFVSSDGAGQWGLTVAIRQAATPYGVHSIQAQCS